MKPTTPILVLSGVLTMGLFLSASRSAHAQSTPKEFFACYVPSTGSVYRIREQGLRVRCVNANPPHVQFSWIDGVPGYDHGFLNGLADDDHPQYLLASGTRALAGNLSAGGNRISGLGAGTVAGDAVRFEQAVKVSDPAGGDLSGTYPNPSLRIFGLPLQSGASPTSGQVLAFDGSAWTPTTPAGGGVADHGTLTGLTDDDHPQYLLADGVRPLAGNLNAGGNRITGLGAGTVAGDAVRFEQAVKLGDGAGGDLTGAYPNPLVKLWGLSLRAGASPTSGQVIAFDGSTWTPMTAGGDLSGRYDNLRVTRLLDSPVSGTIQPITGQVLTFDGSAWAPATPAGGSASDHGGLTGLTDDDHPQYVLADGARPLTGNLNAGGNRISGLGDGTVAGDAVRFEQAVKVTDPAGGDLSGTYPNLRVTKLVNAPVSTTAASPTSGQVLAFDGSAWTPTTPAGAGGPGLGAWDDNRNLNTTYQAATDGFVVVRIASSCGGIEGRTGSNPNSSAVRGFVKEPGSFTMPVRKGDYWMAQENGGCTAFLYWISLGS